MFADLQVESLRRMFFSLASCNFACYRSSIALACYLLNEHMSLPSIDALTDDEPGCVETGLVVQDGRREDPPAKRGVGGLPVKNSRPGATSRHALEARLTRILGSKVSLRLLVEILQVQLLQAVRFNRSAS